MSVRRALAAFLAVAVTGAGAWAQTPAVSFTAAQADQGQDLYADHCALCHGQHLDDGEFAPSMKGARFARRWGALPAAALYAYVSRAMPPGQVGVLGPEDYDDILAFIYQANGAEPGDQPLVAEPAAE